MLIKRGSPATLYNSSEVKDKPLSMASKERAMGTKYKKPVTTLAFCFKQLLFIESGI
ncbi:hypothetical protein M23134_08126 [Microscilla marina ATCC 23134]|uniref:Uncharacterized protein n=1 Tax=Microscilla marina ATCC 23134 TaxID=313606 RepID=A1ZH33_MICM2|nr:hypothetical protein M23134_08126 [Microscilla marina ATCC 23134]